jgi:hypothetical protein
MTPISIGRLLRSNTSSCVIGCKVSQQNAPVFGEMVRIPLSNGVQIYGLVHEIHIDDDGLVRQLVTAAGISDEVIEDNRQNRNMPVEMSVAFIGWEKDCEISHTRAPYPPLSLDEIFTCGEDEITRFLASGKFGYLRALLRNEELPAADLITAHLRQVTQAERASSTIWMENSLREVIALLKDDYPILMDVLSAVSEISE